MKNKRLHMKQIPERTCMGCNAKKKKENLIRIVRNSENNDIQIDKTGKVQGRGAYICDSIDCLEKAIKNKRLEKALNQNIEKEIYDKLRGVIIGK